MNYEKERKALEPVALNTATAYCKGNEV